MSNHDEFKRQVIGVEVKERTGGVNFRAAKATDARSEFEARLLKVEKFRDEVLSATEIRDDRAMRIEQAAASRIVARNIES